jgi:hypothetical protein
VSWVALAAAAVALLAALLVVLAPRLRGRRLEARSARRILFPFVGPTVSRSTLDAALRLARAESATLVPVYVATVPMELSLEAPIPKECEVALPLLDAIERRGARLEVPVEGRIERGRTPRHGLELLLEQERFDRVVVPAGTSHTDGFSSPDIAWLLEHAPGEVAVLRPDQEAGIMGGKRSSTQSVSSGSRS